MSNADLTRRELIKLGAAAAVTASIGGTLSAQPAPAFFTPEEFAVVDELCEMIIPADAHSPGARAAKVALYLDGRLKEASEEKDRTTWRDGVTLIEQLSREASGKSFLESSADERLALLTRIAANERKPEKPEERFFVELKSAVAGGYYTSEIGIKQEMEYKGNTYLAEFAGTDVSS